MAALKVRYMTCSIALCTKGTFYVVSYWANMPQVNRLSLNGFNE